MREGRRIMKGLQEKNKKKRKEGESVNREGRQFRGRGGRVAER